MRNRYLDLLRAAAILRVIVYHLFGWPWLSIALPAMGVMFALAGSLTAASLEKRRAGQVITSRLRRLLPPLWLLGVLAVPVMLVTGWLQENDGEHPFSPARLAFWILPIGDPPGSDQAVDAWEPLWYLRAYLWFVVLSPVLFAVWRRIGWAAVALPLLLMGALEVTGLTLPETADAALWDFVTYGACWIAGFAHHDGRLARVRAWVVGALTVGLGAGAWYWLRDAGTWDLNDVSEAQALWSLAFVLLALRWQPPMGWLARAVPLDRAVDLLNARAVTVYLWHNIAIAAVWPVLAVLALDDLADRLGPVTDLLVALVLTALAVLLFGWAEDLAARRRPRLWPVGGSRPRRTGAARRAEATAEPAHRAPATAEPTAPATAPERADEPAATGPEVPAQNRAARVSGTVSAMADLRGHRRSTAAAAMSRVPANWPPIPRDAPAAGAARTTPAEPAPDDPGLPVAGRRAEPRPRDPAEPGPGESPEAVEWLRGGRDAGGSGA